MTRIPHDDEDDEIVGLHLHNLGYIEEGERS